ncbi:hypothetical protein VaNZ11_005086, partial [Volvox africanus]
MEQLRPIQNIAYTHPNAESGPTLGAEVQNDLFRQLLESLRLSMDVPAPILPAGGVRGRDSSTATPYLAGGVNPVAVAGSGCSRGGSGSGGSNGAAVESVPWVACGGGVGTDYHGRGGCCSCDGGNESLKSSASGVVAVEIPSLNPGSEALGLIRPEELKKVLEGPGPGAT